MHRQSSLLTVCLLASLAVACGGEREPAQDEMAAEDMEAVADEAYDEAYDESQEADEDAMPIAPASTATDCRLSDDYLSVGSSGLEFRIPRGGNSVTAWQVTAMEYDRATMMELISDGGERTVSEVGAPIGTVYYTQHDGDDMTEATVYIFDFSFQLDGKWWRGGLPVRNLNAERAANCAALMPQALASLRRQ